MCGLLTLLLLLWLCVQLKNKYTGKVDLGTVYDSGRYFTSLRRTFITFPAVRNNMEFSNVKGAPHQPRIRLCSCRTRLLGSYHLTFARPPPQNDGAVAPPIQTRTGKPPDSDQSAGGQPLTLSMALQYQIHKETLPQLYSLYGVDYEEVFVMLARQVISDVLQHFSPGEGRQPGLAF